MSVAIIQGASGSIGFALAQHILRHTNLSVYALTHQPKSQETELSERIFQGSNIKDKERLSVLGEIDISEERGLQDAAKLVEEREGKDKVRLITCMAGILHAEKSLSSIDPSKALRQFQINTLGHLLTYKHFVPLIPSKKNFEKLSSEWSSSGDPAKGLVHSRNSLCLSMSARVGSISDNERGGWYSYRASKAATNQITRTLEHELINKNSSALAIGYHPGTVITSFTKPVIGENAKPDPSNGRFDLKQAIDKMTNVMSKAKRHDDANEKWGGRCFDWKGERIQW
ncbi:uncharacterized protein L201_002675 [Kwoniella dendrophila CBS 6074]|uniref:Rossman fold oxidoreductase n=1 Tax=Kwoniella dendrophila CBS 6074 TaxID=1295534 RepID=A0AAX4JSB7_9TREE